MRLSLEKGFSLLELLVVITIIGILSAVAIVSLLSIQKSGRDTKRQSDLKLVQSALEQFHADFNFYPDSNVFAGSSFTDALAGQAATRTYLGSMPTDSGTPYCHQPLPQGCSNSSSVAGGIKCNQYALYTKLENYSGSNSYSCGGLSTYNLQITQP